jgi:hypothetical protein
MMLKGTYTEDPFHQEIVEGLQSDFVGFAERIDQLLGRIRLGILKRLASKLHTTEEPHQAFRRLPLLLPFLVLNQFLQGIG